MILGLRDVVKRYGRTTVLDRISLDVGEGDILGYLGPNGAGKTTTIQIVTSLLRADEGSVEMLGHRVPGAYGEVLGDVGVVFEQNGLYDRLTARQNVEFYLDAVGRPRRPPDIAEMLGRLGLGDAADKRVKVFSKGMRRKLAIGRCLLARPRLLLLDEPFDGVDIENRAHLVDVLREVNHDEGVAMVLTSHVMADIDDLASRVAVIKEGVLLLDEPIAHFRRRPGGSLAQIYLEVTA